MLGIRPQNGRTLNIRPSRIEALGKAELLDYSHNGHLYSVRLYEDFYTVSCDGNDDIKYNYGVSAAFEE